MISGSTLSKSFSRNLAHQLSLATQKLVSNNVQYSTTIYSDIELTFISQGRTQRSDMSPLESFKKSRYSGRAVTNQAVKCIYS